MVLGFNMKALGSEGLPPCIEVGGEEFRLTHTFKHSFVSAVGVYRCGREQVVLKCYRAKPFLLLPLRWAGALMARHEACAMRRVHDMDGVPELLGRHGRTGIVRRFVPGEPLTRRSVVSDSFFPLLQTLIEGIHERGMAYVDLEKPCNILLGSDERPYLIDFQLAFCWPRRLLGNTWVIRAVRGAFQRSDLYHLHKHWRRVRPDQLSEDELAASRAKPWPVRFGNVCMRPMKKIRRALTGRA